MGWVTERVTELARRRKVSKTRKARIGAIVVGGMVLA